MSKDVIDGRARRLLTEERRTRSAGANYPPALFVIDETPPDARPVPEEDVADVTKRLGLDAAPIIEAYAVTEGS